MVLHYNRLVSVRWRQCTHDTLNTVLYIFLCIGIRGNGINAPRFKLKIPYFKAINHCKVLIIKIIRIYYLGCCNDFTYRLLCLFK